MPNTKLQLSTLSDTVRIHTSVSPSGIITHHTVPVELTLADLIDDTLLAEQQEQEQLFLQSTVQDFSPLDTNEGIV